MDNRKPPPTNNTQQVYPEFHTPESVTGDTPQRGNGGAYNHSLKHTGDHSGYYGTSEHVHTVPEDNSSIDDSMSVSVAKLSL